MARWTPFWSSDGFPAVLRPLQPADGGPPPDPRDARGLALVDDLEDDFPLGDDPESTRFTLLVDGEVAGLLQFWEEPDPKYRHASVDLFLDPAHHGRGLGTAALRRLVRHLVEERGHHRITIDPAADNAAAIRSYEKVGFRPVGVMRSYERDAGGAGWHDSLLMELLAEDLVAGATRSSGGAGGVRTPRPARSSPGRRSFRMSRQPRRADSRPSRGCRPSGRARPSRPRRAALFPRPRWCASSPAGSARSPTAWRLPWTGHRLAGDDARVGPSAHGHASGCDADGPRGRNRALEHALADRLRVAQGRPSR